VPSLAAVADVDSRSYTQVPLEDFNSDEPSSQAVKPRVSSLGFTIRSFLKTLTCLRTRFKVIALFRGVSISIFLHIFELAISMASDKFLPSVLSVLPPILFPLLLVQIYTLWTHIVLTHPSSKFIWQRIPPFMATLRTVGPALILLRAAKALPVSLVMAVYGSKSMDGRKSFLDAIIGNMLVQEVFRAITVVPAHMVLIRVQASLLLADEKTIVPLDEALNGDNKGEGSEVIGIKEAWKTFARDAWRRLYLIYVQVFVISLIGGGVLLALWIIFNFLVMFIAQGYIMNNYQF
jgi:hypothetical protein